MPNSTSVSRSLADNIIQRVATLIGEAEAADKPMEIEPHRSRLFELFVTAEGAGLISEDAESNLTAEGLCSALSRQWGLAEAAQVSFERQTKLPTEHLGKMRMLWSIMRMWMEWSYAWERWAEFHQDR